MFSAKYKAKNFAKTRNSWKVQLIKKIKFSQIFWAAKQSIYEFKQLESIEI